MSVIQIKLPFSNAYLVKEKKAILVDAGSPWDAGRILAAIHKAGVAEKDISLLLHTHGHFDHAGSSAALKRRLNIPAAVHREDAFMLREGRNGEIKPRNFEARLVKAIVPSSFPTCEPDMLIEHEIDLSDFGIHGRVIFTPGHTKGSLSVILDTQEAIVGDVMMGGVMGGALFGSRPNYHYFVNDLQAVHASISKLLSFKPATFYVGHGGPLNANEVADRFSNEL